MNKPETRLRPTKRGEVVATTAMVGAGALALVGAGIAGNALHEHAKEPIKAVLQMGIEQGWVANPEGSREHDIYEQVTEGADTQGVLELNPNPPKIDSLPVPEQTSIPVPPQPEQSE